MEGLLIQEPDRLPAFAAGPNSSRNGMGGQALPEGRRSSTGSAWLAIRSDEPHAGSAHKGWQAELKRVVLGLKQLRGYDGFITTDRWDAGDVEVGNFNMTNVASHETADNEVVLVVVACMVVVGDEREGNVSTLARVVWNDLALACSMPGMPVGVVHVTALACHAVLLRIMAKGATSVRQTSLDLKSLQLKWDPS